MSLVRRRVIVLVAASRWQPVDQLVSLLIQLLLLCCSCSCSDGSTQHHVLDGVMICKVGGWPFFRPKRTCSKQSRPSFSGDRSPSLPFFLFFHFVFSFLYLFFSLFFFNISFHSSPSSLFPPPLLLLTL